MDFWKDYSPQECLYNAPFPYPLETTWRANGLTDFSKAFDCLLHEFLIAKSNTYGFSRKALKLMNSYLSPKNQRIKINECHRSWYESFFEVPKRSVLGPILFNIFLSDLFFTLNDIDIAKVTPIVIFFSKHATTLML